MTGNTITLTAANFTTARNTTNGVIVEVSHADGVTDLISIAIAPAGADGTNGTDGTDGADGADGVDGAGFRQIYKRSSSQPSIPSPSTGVPSGYYGTINDVPAGPEPIWAHPGARPDSTSNYTWESAVRWEATVDVAFGLQTALAFSTSATIPFILDPGQTASIDAQLKGSHTGVATTDIDLEYRVEGGSWGGFGTSVPDSGGSGDITVATASGTITNSGSGPVRYEVRATGTRTAANVTPVTAECYLRIA
jgi:hypothetical protein